MDSSDMNEITALILPLASICHNCEQNIVQLFCKIIIIQTEMNQTPLTHQAEGEQENKNCKEKFDDFLVQLDFFSYVPQPHTYPVSTIKSKIASIVFLILVVSYLTYDFVKFITQNQPLINSFEVNVPLDVQYQAPQIAFGFMYGPSLNLTLNDPSYFSYSFYTLESKQQQSTNSTTQTKIPIPIIQNCNPEWLGVYNNVYQNMSCIEGNPKLMNIPSQNANSLSLRLQINACKNNANLTCQPLTQLFKITSGGRFFLILNLPAGFDYNTGTVDQSDYSVEIYQFFLVPQIYSRINIQYYLFEFTTFPTYFTTWQSEQFFYMQSYEPAVQISNVTVFDPSLMMSVSFVLYSALTFVEVKYQTFIDRVSSWGALASLIMTIFGLCCLTYNKTKFLQKNPSWKNFDQAMKRKEQKVIEIQLQNVGEKHQKSNNDENQNQNEESDMGGLNIIRRKVETANL